MKTQIFIHELAKMMGMDRKLPAWAKLPSSAQELEFLTEREWSSMRGTNYDRDTEYGRYLASVDWQRRRVVVMVLARRCCAECPERAAHVHHLTYARRGREWLADLLPLCEGCHARKHETDLERAIRDIGRRRVKQRREGA